MRVKLKILESNVYAKVFFLIAKDVNYNQAIYKEINSKPTTTIEYLKRLVNKKYLNFEIEQKNNKKVYSINYSKLIQEFINFLIQQKHNILTEIEKVKGKEKSLEWFEHHLRPYDYSTYNLLENKEFIENTKNSEYLKIYFREAFKEIGNQKLDISLIDFFRFLLMRELFIEVIEDMRYFIERSTSLNEQYPKDYKNYGDFEKRHELEQEIIKKDKDLENLKQFSDLLYVCRKSVILEFSNNIGLEKIKDLVLFKNFPQKDVKEFKEWCKEHEQIFNENRYFARARKLTMFDNDYFEYKKNKLKILKNRQDKK